MADTYTVGDLVAEFLALCGVRTAFGIVSIHNIPILDAVGTRNTIRFVMSRGEMGAAHMADGYARVSGELGVVISSTGPGAANAVPGLVEARFASTPLLHITGATGTKFAGRNAGAVHDVPDQLAMLASVSKAAYRVHNAEEALGVLTRAAVEALTPPTGPVSIEIPIDLQRAPVRRPAAFDGFVLPLPPRRTISAAELDGLAEQVARARRPLLWLGNGAKGAREPVMQLLDLGFGMVTSWAGRGTVPEDHPRNLGSFTGYGLAAVQDFYRDCDLMLVVGSRMRAHETGEFSVPLPTNLIHVDIDPAACGRTYPASLFVCGDAADTLARLRDRIAGRLQAEPAFGGELAELKKRTRSEHAATLGPYSDFPARLRAVVPRDAVWARDVTISNSTWGNRLFEVYEARNNVYPMSAGIGEGLPLGIGGAIAAGSRKTVIMTGDGGFQLALAELWTAVQEQVEAVILVMNDGGYGVIRQIQDVVSGGRRYYTDLRGPDLGELARVAGLSFRKVSAVDDLDAAMRDMLAVAGPALVEVDMNAIGAHPPYFPFNKKA